MKSNYDKVKQTQWFQIGAAVARGESRVQEFPPNCPNVIIGFFSVVVTDPTHKMWNHFHEGTKSALWDEYFILVNQGAIPEEVSIVMQRSYMLLFGPRASRDSKRSSSRRPRKHRKPVTFSRLGILAQVMQAGTGLVTCLQRSEPDIPGLAVSADSTI